MLFCLSVCGQDRRVILDKEPHGKVLAKIKARHWQHARRKAEGAMALDPYSYKAGHGWFKRLG